MTAPFTDDLGALRAALVPQYELQQEVGRGGMGIVYRARDTTLERDVAVKVLPSHLAEQPGVRERFLREARAAARLSDPGIVPIYGAQDVAGRLVLVMGFVDGESLAARLRREGPLPAAETVAILEQVATALAAAHRRGVVHRDVKPENILLDRGTGRALVTDFGIARLVDTAGEAGALTATGQVLGTVSYMSPEQVTGSAIDGRSDIYALGVVAFQMLSGMLPFAGEAPAVLVAHVTRAAPSLATVAPTIPPDLVRVVDRCLAKDPGDRFATGDALAAALHDALRAPSTTTMIPGAAAEAVWRRAAELQAEDATARDDSYRLRDVRAAAEEAGISERHVVAALAEVRGAGVSRHAPPVATPGNVPAVRGETSSTSLFLGAPTYADFEAIVDGELNAEDMEQIAAVIRRAIRSQGHASMVGRSLEWTSSGQRNAHRKVQVSVTPRGGRTVIRLEEQFTGLAGGLYGGIVGGLGGGGGSSVAGGAAAALHSVALGFAVAGGWVVGAYVLARVIFTKVARSRRSNLEHACATIAAEARELIAAHGQPAALGSGARPGR